MLDLGNAGERLFVSSPPVVFPALGGGRQIERGKINHTPEFKKLVIETMQEEKLSYSETCRRFKVNSRDRIKSWERIYLEEGPEGFAVERRGRGSSGRPKKMPKDVEEELLAEVQRLRAENDYLKNLQALVLEYERRQRGKRW